MELRKTLFKTYMLKKFRKIMKFIDFDFRKLRDLYIYLTADCIKARNGWLLVEYLCFQWFETDRNKFPLLKLKNNRMAFNLYAKNEKKRQYCHIFLKFDVLITFLIWKPQTFSFMISKWIYFPFFAFLVKNWTWSSIWTRKPKKWVYNQ